MMTLLHELLSKNWQVFEDFNQRAGHQALLDPLMVFGAQDAIVLAPLLLLALWFVCARWSLLGRNRMKAVSEPERGWLEEDRQLGQRVAVLGVVSVVFALALNVALGLLVNEPRPFVSHPGIVHELIPHVIDNSFPSDHEAVIGAVTTVLGLYLLFIIKATVEVSGEALRAVRMSLEVRRRFLPEIGVAVSLFALAFVALGWIGVARVYTGVHYPGDIIVGALCGFVGGVFAVALRPLVDPLVRVGVRLAERVRLA
jgi:undecaprenyl-diphosphatase